MKKKHKGKNLRALLVSPSSVDRYPPVQYQARLLATNGIEVHLLSSPKGSQPKIEFNFPGVEVHRFRTEHSSKLIRLKSLVLMMVKLSMLRQQRPTCEIDFDPVGVVVGERAFGQTDITIHHHHEILFKDNRGRYISKAREAIGNADVIIVADEDRRQLMEAEDPPPRRSITVRNAPTVADVVNGNIRRTEAFSVVYFGSVGPAQCLDTALKSMKDWPDDVCLHIYGARPDGYTAELLKMAKTLGVAERIVFESWVSTRQLLPAVAQHHLALTLLRPLNDNWRYSAGASNKRFQAMAAGVPQISDNGIGVEELIYEAGAGVCVNPDDPSAVAEAVNAYYSDPIRVETEGKKGRAHITDSLNYEREFAPIVKIIKAMEVVD